MLYLPYKQENFAVPAYFSLSFERLISVAKMREMNEINSNKLHGFLIKRKFQLDVATCCKRDAESLCFLQKTWPAKGSDARGHKDKATRGAMVRARLPPMSPGVDWRHMWVEFVGSLPCSERFFSGYYGFPLSTKTKS